MEPDPRKRLIRVSDTDSTNPLILPSPSSQQTKIILHLVRDALVRAPVLLPEDYNDTTPAFVRLFQRKPFRPNYVTNVHFTHSIWTMGINILVNHAGYPYYGRILQHRKLIVAIGVPLFLAFILLAEGVPQLNAVLELRPFQKDTTQIKSQLQLMMIFAIDLFGCYLIPPFCKPKRRDTNCINLSKSSSLYDDENNEDTNNNTAKEEEKLLNEESGENASLVRIMISSISMVFLNSLAKTLELQQKSNEK